jgi:hypothetical protein
MTKMLFFIFFWGGRGGGEGVSIHKTAQYKMLEGGAVMHGYTYYNIYVAGGKLTLHNITLLSPM